MNVSLEAVARSLAQKLDRRMQRPPSQPKTRVAVQEDGTVITNEHRILNFLGPGVAVSDDPAQRRTNVFIPGAPAASASSTVSSNTTTTHAKTLWNGSSNNAPPANWYTLAFVEDGTWGVAVAANQTGGQPPPAGTTAVWKTAAYLNSNEANLFRQVFALVAGSVTSATLTFDADSFVNDFRINGTTVATKLATASSQSPQTISLSPSLFIMGGSNIIAVHAKGFNPTTSWGAWKIEFEISSAAVDTQYQLLAEKDQNDGYAGLDSSGLVPDAELAASGTPDATTFLRGDRTWASASTNSVVVEEIDGTPSVAADTIRFTNGTVTNDGGGQVTVDVSGILHMPYVKAQDQKTQNTAGGSATSGSFATRTLNTLVTDTDSIASLASNQVTLPAGTYDCFARAPGALVGRHQIRVQDVTHSTTLILGANAFSGASGGVQNDAVAHGRFTIASSSAIELQHRVQTTTATFGLGNEANFGTEVYASIEFRKVG